MSKLLDFICWYAFLFLPQVIIIFMFIVIGIYFLIKKNQGDFHRYYTKQEEYNNSKRNLFDVLSGIVSIIYVEGTIISFTLLFSIALYKIPVIKFREAFTTFSDISSSLPQELLNWLAIIVTLVAMLVAFRKEYYLVFSVPDVLEQYKFKKRTLNVLNLMIIAKIFDIAKDCLTSQPYNIAFKIVIIITYIRAIVLCVYLINKVMDILYSQDKIELKLLDKLYYKVRNKLLISSACYNENVAETLINCNYLCQKHMREYYNTDKTCLKNIQLHSVHEEKLDIVYKNVVNIMFKKGNKYLLIVSFVYIFFFALQVAYKKIYFFEILIMLLISWASWLFLFLVVYIIKNRKFIKIKQMLNKMFFSDYVYLSKSSKGKTIITSLFGLCVSKDNTGYLKSLLNISIYWKITLSGESEKNIKAFKTGLRENRDIYRETQNDFDEIIFSLCYFIEYMSITGDKKEFWNEINTEDWL